MSPTKRLFALLNKANLTRDQRLTFYYWMTGRQVNSTNDLTEIELAEITTQLWKWDRAGILPEQVAKALP